MLHGEACRKPDCMSACIHEVAASVAGAHLVGGGLAQRLCACGCQLRAGDQRLAAGAGIHRASGHVPHVHLALATAAQRMVVHVPGSQTRTPLLDAERPNKHKQCTMRKALEQRSDERECWNRPEARGLDLHCYRYWEVLLLTHSSQTAQSSGLVPPLPMCVCQ